MAIKFEKAPPEWHNKGIEPTVEDKQDGFLAGYKLPAAYLNWFWSNSSECIKELQEQTTALDNTKYEKMLVSELPTISKTYDFEDKQTVFSIPSISSTVKGISDIVSYADGSGYYQRLCSTGAPGASATIGSSAIVYSDFDISELTQGAKSAAIEFDFQLATNGRIRIAIADISHTRQLTGSTKYDTNGIAVDIFSTSNNQFQINSKGGAHASFFGTWLHAKFNIDFEAKKVEYVVTNKANTSDAISGIVDFKGDCTQITGIAVYTWLADDNAYFDNISITSRVGEVRENVRYIVKKDDIYEEYQYIDGKPVPLGSSQIEELPEIKDKLDSHTHAQYALIASPTFTGTPKAPTPAQSANTTQIATTAFVKTALESLESKLSEQIEKIGSFMVDSVYLKHLLRMSEYNTCSNLENYRVGLYEPDTPVMVVKNTSDIPEQSENPIFFRAIAFSNDDEKGCRQLLLYSNGACYVRDAFYWVYTGEPQSGEFGPWNDYYSSSDFDNMMYNRWCTITFTVEHTERSSTGEESLHGFMSVTSAGGTWRDGAAVSFDRLEQDHDCGDVDAYAVFTVDYSRNVSISLHTYEQPEKPDPEWGENYMAIASISDGTYTARVYNV